MTGLIKKDFYNIAGSLKIYLLIPALFAFLSYSNKSMDLLSFGTCFVSIFVIITCYAYDDMAHFNDYALTLPISRKDLVLSKFLLGNLFMMIVFVIANVLAFGMDQLFPDRFMGYDAMYFLEYTYAATMAVNIITSFILLVMFKYGSEKGRIVFIVCFLAIGLLGGLLGNQLSQYDFSGVIAFLDQYLLILMFPVSLLAEGIAILISIKIMKHKEL